MNEHATKQGSGNGDRAAVEFDAIVVGAGVAGGIVNLFALMQYQGERESVSLLLSFRQPKLEA